MSQKCNWGAVVSSFHDKEHETAQEIAHEDLGREVTKQEVLKHIQGCQHCSRINWNIK